MYGGGGPPPHIYSGILDPEGLYLSPAEPPVSLYGTLPRGGLRVRGALQPANPHYATLGKEKLQRGRASIKLMQNLMNNDKADTQSILSGRTNTSGQEAAAGGETGDTVECSGEQHDLNSGLDH